MAIGNTLQNEVKGWGTLVMIIVILSVILLKMRISDSVACSNGYYFNTTAAGGAICCNSATTCVPNTSVTPMYGDINTYITAFSEPKNWVLIVIIAIIGIYLMKKFAGKNSN